MVKQIMAQERTTVAKLDERKAKFQEKSKLVNDLNDLMQKLLTDLKANNSYKSFREVSVNADNTIIDVNADKDLVDVGEWQFEVVQLAQKSTALSTGVEDPEGDYLGVGFIQYTLPDGETKDLYINQDESTLKGVAEKINATPDIGMKANIFHDGTDSDTPWRLLFSLNQGGDEYVAEFPYFYFVDGEVDFTLDEEREAHDAIIKLNGMQIELPTNKNSELIKGLTIDLKKAKPGEEFTIKVTENIQAITEKLTVMIDKINQVIDFIQKQNALDEKTDTSRTLGGDLSLQTIESRMRNIILTPIQTAFGNRRLGDYGISFQRNGRLSMDPKKLESSLAKNYTMGTQFFIGYVDRENDINQDGFIKKMSDVTDSFIRMPDGVLYLRKTGIRSTMDQIERQIESKERLLDQKEKILKDKFSRLEGIISKLRGQGAGLAGFGGGADASNQLGG
jgi:flagellar hook-associated protein 2